MPLHPRRGMSSDGALRSSLDPTQGLETNPARRENVRGSLSHCAQERVRVRRKCGCLGIATRAASRDQRLNLILVRMFNAPIRRTSASVSLSGNRSMISVLESPSLMPRRHFIK